MIYIGPLATSVKKMKKVTNILLFLFIGLTTFLVIIHLKNVEYFIDSKTNESSIQISNKNFNVNYSINKDSENNLHLGLSFCKIKTKFQVLELKVKVNKLEIIEIEPYWGMEPSKNGKFKRFVDIPDSLKYLSTESNPYYAYDHLFKDKSKTKKYNVEIEALIHENDNNYSINRKSEIERISKIEVRPWDMHSDLTFLLIYLFGFISILLIVIKVATIIIIGIRRK